LDFLHFYRENSAKTAGLDLFFAKINNFQVQVYKVSGQFVHLACFPKTAALIRFIPPSCRYSFAFINLKQRHHESNHLP
jgi:hypothetical protein